MMRSESTSALGHPRETKLTVGAGAPVKSDRSPPVSVTSQRTRARCAGGGMGVFALGPVERGFPVGLDRSAGIRRGRLPSASVDRTAPRVARYRLVLGESLPSFKAAIRPSPDLSAARNRR